MTEERGGMLAKLLPPVVPMPATSLHGAVTTLQAAAPASRCPEALRQRYFVELRDGETTYVSWKKLVQQSESKEGASGAPAGANPALEARISPEV